MNNVFINSGANEDTINMDTLNSTDWLYDVVENQEQYEEWVQSWRKYHTGLVHAIQFFKKEKNRLRDEGQFSYCHNAWTNAVKLGNHASEIYKYRNFNKALHHANFLLNENVA